MTKASDPMPGARATPPLTFDLNGYRIALTVPDAAARAAVLRIFGGFAPLPGLPDGAATAYALIADDDARWEVSARGHVCYRSAQLADALVALEWQLVTDTIAHRRELFHLHAAALAAPARGATLLIVGVSGSGKTTATLGLMARGLLPYSDDVTLIAADTALPHPFRRAFHSDATTRALIEQLPDPPTWDFDGPPAGYFVPPRWAETPFPIRMVLFPTLAPGAPPTLVPLSVADAVARLLPFSATLMQDAPLALRVGARIAGAARCYALTTGDLDATTALVLDQLQRDCGSDG